MPDVLSIFSFFSSLALVPLLLAVVYSLSGNRKRFNFFLYMVTLLTIAALLEGAAGNTVIAVALAVAGAWQLGLHLYRVNLRRESDKNGEASKYF